MQLFSEVAFGVIFKHRVPPAPQKCLLHVVVLRNPKRLTSLPKRKKADDGEDTVTGEPPFAKAEVGPLHCCCGFLLSYYYLAAAVPTSSLGKCQNIWQLSDGWGNFSSCCCKKCCCRRRSRSRSRKLRWYFAVKNKQCFDRSCHTASSGFPFCEDSSCTMWAFFYSWVYIEK